MNRLPLAIRLAARELRRHLLRSALVVAMVLIPVAACCALAALAAYPPQDSVSHQLGSLEASTLIQPAVLRETDCVHSDDPRCSAPDPGPRPVESLEGTKEWETRGTVEHELDGRTVTREVAVANLGSAHAGQRYHQPPAAPRRDEVLIDWMLAQTEALRVGDMVTLNGEKYRVAGTVDALDPGERIIVGPGHPLAGKLENPHRRAYLYGPEPDAERIASLTAAGFHLTTRSELAAINSDPPPIDPAVTAVLLLAATLACLLTATVSAMAFAVGVRQQRRTLALLSATGAPGEMLQHIVLWQGALLGGTGGVLGAVLGTTLGHAVRDWMDSRIPGFPQPSPDVNVPLAIGTALLGLGSATLAAWWPSREVAGQDVLAAVREAEAPQRAPRTPAGAGTAVVIGLAIVALGAQVAAADRSRADGTVPVEKVVLPSILGIVLVFLGLAMASGWLVWRASRTAQGGPLAWRLAWRDAGRNRSRAAAGIAASMATGALVSGALVAIASMEATDVEHMVPFWPSEVIAVREEATGSVDVIRDAVERHVGPVTAQARLTEFTHCDNGDMCGPAVSLTLMPEVCTSQCIPLGLNTKVYTPEAFAALVGRGVTTEEQQTLDAGGLLVLDPRLGAGTEVQVTSAGMDAPRPTVRSVSGTRAELALGTVAALRRYAPDGEETPGPTLLRTTPSTDEQRQAVIRDLRDSGHGALGEDVAMDAGGPDLDVVKWVAVIGLVLMLLVAAAAASLAQRDGRRTQVTLATIGAAPRTVRTVSAMQAAVVTGTGALLGLLVGMVPMAGAIWSTRGGVTLAVPWGWLALPVLGAPAAVSALTWVFARPPRAQAVRVA